jgi:hypothetical protein
MSTEYKESTVIQSKLTRIVHLKPFLTLEIGLTGIGIWIIQMIAKTIVQWPVNLIGRNTIALMIGNP